jgi:hypothetical protein
MLESRGSKVENIAVVVRGGGGNNLVESRKNPYYVSSG